MARAFGLALLLTTLVGAIVALESLQGFKLVRILQCGIVLAMLGVLTATSRGRWRDLCLGGASLFLGLIVLEGLALAVEKSTPITTDSGLSRDRPVVGWGAGRPGVYHVVKQTADRRLIYDVEVTIDDRLNRKTVTNGADGGIAFFGDSFTFGEGLPDGDTLPQSYADLTHRSAPVFNLGYSGWSPAQNLAALQTGLYKPYLASARRFVLMTAAWHMERTACKAGFSLRAPRYVPEGDGVKLDGSCAGPVMVAWHGFIARFALYRVVVAPGISAPSRSDAETYLKIVESFVRTAKRDYGAATTILFLPFNDAYLKPAGMTEAELLSALRKTGADVIVDALPQIADPKAYEIQGDGHPTGLANRARAQEIVARFAGTERTMQPDQHGSQP